MTPFVTPTPHVQVRVGERLPALYQQRTFVSSRPDQSASYNVARREMGAMLEKTEIVLITSGMAAYSMAASTVE